MPETPTLRGSTARRPLLILKTGDTHEALRNARGDFEQWVALGLDAPGLPLRVVDARHAGALPAPAELAGLVITGSHAMVSHRAPWSEAASAWLAAAVRAGTPVLGICYGHQLLADAMGGLAGDHPQAMEIGTVEVELTDAAQQDPLLRDLPRHFDAHVVHRQSALRLPPGAVLLARNAFEPHQAFRVGAQAWGVQFHPEFDEAAMHGYIDALADTLAAEGRDPAALRRDVRATPQAAGLLARFARLVQDREAARAEPAEALC